MRQGVTKFEPFGFHNDHLEEESQRIEESAAWRNQRVVAMLPAGNLVPTEAAMCWWNLAFPPNGNVGRYDGAVKYLAKGFEVGVAYTKAIEDIIENPDLKGWEFLLTLEIDNLPDSDALLKLLKSMHAHPELSCVSSLYWTKGEKGCPQIWGDPSLTEPLDFRPQPPRGGVQECNGTGMGFALWRLDMFRDPRLPRPFFETKSDETGTATQDLLFWSNARQLGYRCAVDCDCRVGHIDYAGSFGPRGKIW